MSDPTNEPSREPICEPTKRMDLDALLLNNLSQINNAVLSNHSNQQESLTDQPGIDEEINYPIAASDSSQPTPINLDSSGLRCSSRTEVLNRCGLVYSDTTLMDHDERMTSPQTAHLHLASQQSFSSAHVLFSTICPFGGLSYWVQSLAVKVQASSTPTASHHAFALFAFEPVTSTKQISSPNTALNATVEMQPSADISENLGTQLIFQLIDAYISNRDEMCSASQLAVKLLHHKSSCASQLAECAQCLKSHKTSCIFQLVACAKCHNKSNLFTFKLIVGFIQKFQSQLQQDLVDLSLLHVFSIAKLNSISIKAKSNSAMLIDSPTSQRSTLLYFNGGSSRLIVEYIYSSNSEGAHSPPTTFTITQALNCQRLIVTSIRDKIPFIFCNEQIVFCEGEWKGKDGGGVIIKQRLLSFVSHICISGLVGFIHFGHISLVGLSLTGLIGHISLNGLIGDIGFGLISLVGLSGFGLVGLSSIIGLIVRISLAGFVGLSGFGLISLVGIIGFRLVSLSGINGLIG
jgi:hypothetical protein